MLNLAIKRGVVMKKKIKDLTPEEARKICCKIDWCDSCPLFATHKCIEYTTERYVKEVEVDE